MNHTRENGRDSEQNMIGLITCHVLSAVEANEADSWIIDSGATCHICKLPYFGKATRGYIR